jgi:transposase
MAGKPKPMSQIKQLILMQQQGFPIKKIARVLQMSKNTVKQYLVKLHLLDIPSQALLTLADPELEHHFHAGNPAYSDPRFGYLKDKLDYFAKELERKGVTRKLLWEEYRQAHPDGYQYAQFCFHLAQHQRNAKPSMVLEHKPADKLYVDFAGRTAAYVDPDSGEVHVCQLFVACLPCSDYGFVLAVPSQKTADFLFALERCLLFLGGVPAAVVPDNLKSAVTKACRYEPTISEALEHFANHYNVCVIPTRVAHPKDKALVENHVRLIYQRVLAPLRNQVFFSLSSLNEALATQNQQLNQTRMQLKDHTREEKFLAAEKPLLRPLPDRLFEQVQYHQATVQKNNHILLTQDKHYYSVPYTHIGKTAKIHYTRTLVHIYIQGQKVATHQRSRTSNGYTTIKDHLCSHHQHYLSRSPEYYQQRAAKISPTFHQLIKLVFTRPQHPEQWYRTCDGLFRLQRNSEASHFDKACALAISCSKYSMRFIQQVLKANQHLDPPQAASPPPLPDHDNVRGPGFYQ